MRPIWFFSALLELTSPGAVSQPGEAQADTIDARVERDRDDGYWVPGTSIAGALRGHYLAHKDEQTVRELLGWVEDKTREQLAGAEPKATASRIRVLGTHVIAAADASSVTIQQTAIDRHRKAARNSTLRSGEFMPVGTRVRVDISTEDEKARRSLAELLPSWQPIVGRGRTNGFGMTRLVEISWGELDRSTRDGLRTWLTEGGPDLVARVTAANTVEPISTPAAGGIEVIATVVEDLMIRSGKPVPEQNGRTVTHVMKRGNRPYVPATSLRGFIRSRMEYILRSLGAKVCPDTDCGECWPCEMFGFGGTPTEPGRRGRARFHDAWIERTQLARRQRNSIDRFTGGAADQRLWTEEVVENGRFVIKIDPLPMPLSLDLDEAKAKKRRAEDALRWQEFEALLTLVWRDVHDGYHRLGGGVTTGHGRLALDDADLGVAKVQEAIAVVQQLVARAQEETAA